MSLLIRSRISRAAFSVKVMVRRASTGTPSAATSHRKRQARVRVFPVPAPAVTTTSFLPEVTARI